MIAVDSGYDTVVIGAGLGGLTAGALCARAGKRVLVLERNAEVGGAATVYRHGNLNFEVSLHEIDGLDKDDPKLPLLQSLGIDRGLTFVDVGTLHEVRSPLLGLPFRIPHGIEAAYDEAARRFPQQRASLRQYFDRLAGARSVVAEFSRHRDDGSWWLRHAPHALHGLWTVLREGRASLAEVLTELFGNDEAVKLALAANLAYYHDDPDTILFLQWAVPQASYLIGGGHYVQGGSRALSAALAQLIRDAHGAIATGREAYGLEVQGSRVIGVRHRDPTGADDRLIAVPTVLANAAPARIQAMLPEALQAGFAEPFAKRKPSISLWTVGLGLSRPPADFGVTAYSTFLFPEWFRALGQFRESAQVLAQPEKSRVPAFVAVDYSQIRSGLNAEPPYFMSLCGIDSVDHWSALDVPTKRQRKQLWMERLIGTLEAHFPGIAASTIQREMSTAETMQRYLNTPGGSVYGFAPASSLRELLGRTPRTSIDGLWLASAYTSGGGFTGAMLGGAEAARSALAAGY